MKKIFLTTALASVAMMAQAQNTYLNDAMSNTSGDVYGSSRYVGMGGAMGALGADLSVISWNPAGVGLMRKGDASFTTGVIWDKKGTDEISKGTATLDQAGFIYSVPFDEYSKTKYVNVAINYQRTKNFNNSFYADNNHLNGLSQMSQLAELVNNGYDTNNNLAGLAVDEGYLTPVYGENDKIVAYDNVYNGELNRYTQHTWGGIHSFDFNISSNYNDRLFWGVTFGLNNLRYRAENDYYEESTDPVSKQNGDYSLYNDVKVDGFGFNMKFGIIARPFEESPFRVGLTIETPTWYQIKNSTLYNLTDHVNGTQTGTYESYLESSIRTPLKVRASLASTIGSTFAWDVDYEFANYGSTKAGYPNNDVDAPDGNIFDNTWDKSMNQLTETTLKGVHTIRAGVEFRPVSPLSLRLGYNYSTSAYKKNPSFDQLALDSYAMNYATSTSYQTLSDAHIITAGVGFRWDHCYLDLAYKYRDQKADFYAFNVYNTKGNALSPVKTDLSNHQITATLGFKF